MSNISAEQGKGWQGTYYSRRNYDGKATEKGMRVRGRYSDGPVWGWREKMRMCQGQRRQRKNGIFQWMNEKLIDINWVERDKFFDTYLLPGQLQVQSTLNNEHKMKSNFTNLVSIRRQKNVCCLPTHIQTLRQCPFAGRELVANFERTLFYQTEWILHVGRFTIEMFHKKSEEYWYNIVKRKNVFERIDCDLDVGNKRRRKLKISQVTWLINQWLNYNRSIQGHQWWRIKRQTTGQIKQLIKKRLYLQVMTFCARRYKQLNCTVR